MLTLQFSTKQIEKFAKWMQDSDHQAYQAKEDKEADDEKDEEKLPLKAAAASSSIQASQAKSSGQQ